MDGSVLEHFALEDLYEILFLLLHQFAFAGSVILDLVALGVGGMFGAGCPFSAIWCSMTQFLFPATLIKMNLSLFFPFYQVVFTSGVILHYSVCYRNLPLCFICNDLLVI